MITNNQDGTGKNNTNVTGADIPLMLKARYFGSGLVVGVLISPVVKTALAKLQPKLDGLLNSLTGQAESFVEKGTDLMAKAKDVLRKEGNSDADSHAGHDHPAGNA